MVFPDTVTPFDPVGGGVVGRFGSSVSEHAVKNERPNVVITAVIPARSINSLRDFVRLPDFDLIGSMDLVCG
jgi:hypothetical protein